MTKLSSVKEKVELNKITHSIRIGQAVMEYGVGAMVDFADQTLMTAAPEFWEEGIIRIHDERLAKVLGVDYFGMPGNKISFVRFPQWYFCPKCRRFQSLEVWLKEYRRKTTDIDRQKNPYMKKPRCLECKTDLVPSRIVIACERGHIDDFPWIAWVHIKDKDKKQICSNPLLTFSTGASTTAGLEGLVIKCETCKAKATLSGAFDKDAIQSVLEKIGVNNFCNGFMPWKNKYENCDCVPQTVQRGASKIYFSKVDSSLVIPPYSDELNVRIEQSKRYSECLTIIREYSQDYSQKEYNERIQSKIDTWAEEIAREIAREMDAVKRILIRKLLEKNEIQSDDRITNNKYRIEEYEALTGRMSSAAFDGFDFVREEINGKFYNIPGLKKVVLVHKIREVRALTGFSRLYPPNGTLLGASSEMDNRLVCVKEPETKWYPAYEVRGEGIFLEFEDENIKQWLNNNPELIQRSKSLLHQYLLSNTNYIDSKIVSPKFLLLHSLAHLLIRQLSFECGYTAASLRERIYCNSPEDDYEMSGLFIYTASGDSEGTLGGLVRQGRMDCLPKIVFKAIETAMWCSNDPVCIQSHGQGRNSLNLSACHACTLLPETSCEEFNVLLDRGVVIGTLENRKMGYFNEWIIKGE